MLDVFKKTTSSFVFIHDENVANTIHVGTLLGFKENIKKLKDKSMDTQNYLMDFIKIKNGKRHDQDDDNASGF
jgi:hypothetical protein